MIGGGVDGGGTRTGSGRISLVSGNLKRRFLGLASRHAAQWTAVNFSFLLKRSRFGGDQLAMRRLQLQREGWSDTPICSRAVFAPDGCRDEHPFRFPRGPSGRNWPPVRSIRGSRRIGSAARPRVRAQRALSLRTESSRFAGDRCCCCWRPAHAACRGRPGRTATGRGRPGRTAAGRGRP